MLSIKNNEYLTWRFIWVVACIIVALVFTGCDGGGGDDCETATVNITGTWSGTWQSGGGGGGNLTFVSLLQTDSMVTGSVSFTGSPCFSGGAVSGEVCGDTFIGSLRAGNISVDFDVTVTGDQMNGTYDVDNAGACTGDTGTISATR